LFNVLTLLPLIKTLLPALLVISEAFRYGISKHGSDTWKNRTAEFHAAKATERLTVWVSSPMQYSLLADAGLRLLFALCLVTGKTYVPKEPTVVETKPEQ